MAAYISSLKSMCSTKSDLEVSATDFNVIVVEGA
jgi:hypothetical protein